MFGFDEIHVEISKDYDLGVDKGLFQGIYDEFQLVLHYRFSRIREVVSVYHKHIIIFGKFYLHNLIEMNLLFETIIVGLMFNVLVNEHY